MRVLHAQERAREVHVEHALPLVPLEEMRRPAAGDSRGGHDRVDAPVLVRDRVEHARDRVLVAHVGLRELDFGRARRQRDRFLRSREIDAHDTRAFGREASDSREPDPRRRAGDHRDLAVKTSHEAVLAGRVTSVDR